MKPYYQDGAVTIYHANMREAASLGPVDHIITDPPFEKEAHTLQRRCKGRKSPDGKSYWGDREVKTVPLKFDAITPEDREILSTIAAQIVKRWCLVFCQIEALHLWRSTLETNGLRYKRSCIWIKPNGQPQLSGDRPGMGYETFIAAHAKGRTRWNGGGKHGTFRHNTSSHENSNGAQEHQTVKPISLMSELVSLFTLPGESILDPFMGSGTTLRAAKDLGRKAIGIEVNERYCELAAKRMAQEVLAL